MASLDEAEEVMRKLTLAGMKKINFSGGEVKIIPFKSECIHALL
jgi:hypothetical protein